MFSREGIASGGKQSLAVFGLLALALTLLGASATPSAPALTYEPEPAFCNRTVVRDYLARVPKHPPTEPKRDGRLHFGPSSIRIKALPQLLVGGGEVGYQLHLRPGAKAAHPRWKIRTTLARVHLRKRLNVFVDATQRQLKTIGRTRGAGISFEVPDEPAYYLLNARFTNLAGRVLGSYRFYFRVVPVTTRARLVLNASAFARGSTVFGQIENLGTASISYGAGARIERFDGVSWIRPPELPPQPVPAILYLAHAGAASRCFAFDVPPSLAPGRYRMVKEVDFFTLSPTTPSLRGREVVPLTAEFDVVP